MDANKLPDIGPDRGEWDEVGISRTGFLRFGFWTISALAGFTVTGTGARFFLGHSLLAGEQRWVEVGKISELAPGTMHRVVYSYQIKDVWRTLVQTGLMYVFSPDGATWTVLEATCSHLGCNVKWNQETHRFLCPCHGGVFSEQGEVLDGPPPRALRRLQNKVQDGNLMALV